MSPARPEPAVSVILPTYQRRELVRRAVASALVQSWADLELIVIDDGSSDGTGEVLDGVDPRLRYIWQPNAGVSAARNRGLGEARAPIVTFLDSDNRWLPDHLATLIELLDRHPRAVLATTCPRYRLAGREDADRAELHDLRDQVSAAAWTGGFASCVGIRRAALERVGPFDGRIKAGEDTDLWLRLACIGPFATVRRRTVVRQTTPDSLSATAQRDGLYLAGNRRTAQNLAELAERLPEPDRRRIRTQARGALHLVRAMSELDRGGEDSVIASELALGDRLLGVSGLPLQLESRIRRHLTGGQDLETRMRALVRVADLWPDPGADTPRYLRALAVLIAVRLLRPREAVRIARGWSGASNLAFARRVAPLAHARLLMLVQDWRLRPHGRRDSTAWLASRSPS